MFAAGDRRETAVASPSDQKRAGACEGGRREALRFGSERYWS